MLCNNRYIGSITVAIFAGIFYLNLQCKDKPTDWGSITITPVGDTHEVVLENSLFRAVYKKSPNDWAGRHPTCMVEYHYKKVGKELIENGRWDDMLDPIDHSKEPLRPLFHYREKLSSAEIIYDGPDKKTVRLTWANSEEEISIFPDSEIVQIDYNRWYVLITDWPTWPQGPDVYKEQMFAIYGADKWHRTYDPLDSTRQSGLAYDDIYFDRKPSDQHKQKGIIDPRDGGPLSYKGWFIVGAYKTATGYGFARVVPVERVSALILWRWRAWEFCFDGEGTITTYLYPVSEGAAEIISIGKSIADQNPLY